MKIHFESGGGVTGPAGRRNCVVGDDELPSDLAPLAASLRQGKFELPASASPRPDEGYVELTIEDEGFQRTISVPRRKLAAELRPLVRWLEERALSPAD